MPLSPDEEQIFQAGSAPETVEQPQQVAPEPSEEDRAISAAIDAGVRGPVGRTAAPIPAAQPAAPQPTEDDTSIKGLIQAVVEERRKRHDLESRLERFEKQQQQPQQPQQPQRPWSDRLFEEPEKAFDERVQAAIAPVLQQQAETALDYNLKLAALQFPDKFQPAYASWMEAVGDPARPDPHTYFRIMQSGDPGAAMVKWHQERTIAQTVGDDLDAFLEKKKAEWIAEQNGRAPNGQFVAPRHEVRLPTSPAKLAASGGGVEGDAMDGSEDAIFNAGRPQRRNNR